MRSLSQEEAWDHENHSFITCHTTEILGWHNLLDIPEVNLLSDWRIFSTFKSYNVLSFVYMGDIPDPLSMVVNPKSKMWLCNRAEIEGYTKKEKNVTRMTGTLEKLCPDPQRELCIYLHFRPSDTSSNWPHTSSLSGIILVLVLVSGRFLLPWTISNVDWYPVYLQGQRSIK